MGTRHDVYIANLNGAYIYKFSSSNKNLQTFYIAGIAGGAGALAYYNGNIWITLGPDAQGRPLFGSLSPSGNFSEIALPILGPTDGPTALVDGPDGHLWYLRGHQVGEILSKI